MQFNPQNLSAGILGAYRDGLHDDVALKSMLPKAQDAEAAAKEQARIAASNPAAYKAFLSGAAKGTGFHCLVE